MLPTLRQLQFFTSLARHQSFTKAADEACVSQSTLSAGIKELESILDVPLVDRSSRQFALTAIGEEMLPKAAAVLASTADLVAAAEKKPVLSGELKLGLIPTIGPFLLPKAIAPLEAQYPALKLYLREDLTHALAELMAAGRLDMAVLALPVDEEAQFSSLIFAQDPFFFVCPKEHPQAGAPHLSTAEVNPDNLMLLDDGHCLADQALSACNLSRSDIARSFSATSLFTLTQMVRSGLGTTLMPKLAIDAGLVEGTGLVAVPMRETDGRVPARDLGLLWREGSGRTEEAQALADLLETTIKK